MATHSSVLVWRILWTEKPDGLQSLGSLNVRHDWVTKTFTFILRKIVGKSLKKIKNRTTVWPTNPTSGWETKEMKIGYQRDNCTPTFTAALFPVAKTWKQPTCPSKGVLSFKPTFSLSSFISNTKSQLVQNGRLLTIFMLSVCLLCFTLKSNWGEKVWNYIIL